MGSNNISGIRYPVGNQTWSKQDIDKFLQHTNTTPEKDEPPPIRHKVLYYSNDNP